MRLYVVRDRFKEPVGIFSSPQNAVAAMKESTCTYHDVDTDLLSIHHEPMNIPKGFSFTCTDDDAEEMVSATAVLQFARFVTEPVLMEMMRYACYNLDEDEIVFALSVRVKACINSDTTVPLSDEFVTGLIEHLKQDTWNPTVIDKLIECKRFAIVYKIANAAALEHAIVKCARAGRFDLVHTFAERLKAFKPPLL